ncbi:MAG: alpha-glucuronidase [Candidatus Marinimicrobia bacterium]|nr:alpha-glucuronidase [Candidatus Neomarinimicrobiota bacterium]
MKFKNKLCTLCILLIHTVLGMSILLADDGYELWLKYRPLANKKILKEYKDAIKSFVVFGNSETQEIIKREIGDAIRGLLGESILNTDHITDKCLVVAKFSDVGSDIVSGLKHIFNNLGDEDFIIRNINLPDRQIILISGNTDIACLYGSFWFIRHIQMEKSIKELDIVSIPKIKYRLLNHWDNLDGTVERGYAGKSIWKWHELPEKIDKRYYDYARANASIGINGTVLNNVNATPKILIRDYLIKIAKLAEIFRPYGIRVFLSVNFASPLKNGGIGNLDTADPFEPEVRKWWKKKIAEIYELIPDFGGFLVKANSEGMPGPLDYGRSHADGANMLAETLKPYGGIVMWRAFVYNPETDPDRVKRAYKEFVPLDGKFLKNVFIQVKNGPLDFQPREPVHPLFGAMPNTPLMLELQITQEYLGHSNHLVFLASMWREYLDFDLYCEGKGTTLARVIDGSVYNYHMTGIAGVSNIGNDSNWCGYIFAQANWYAFGRLAWDHTLKPKKIADEWITLTLTKNEYVKERIKKMMLGSWEALVNYRHPLGLHHLMESGSHYGVDPGNANEPRIDWTSVYYHRADSIGIGYNRSSTGSNAVSQYCPPLSEIFDNIETCPEKYLLWFHQVPWRYKMKSGRTLWEEMCFKYNSGVEYVKWMKKEWQKLKNDIDPEIWNHVNKKLRIQYEDAKLWRDTCLEYFSKFSKIPVPDFN